MDGLNENLIAVFGMLTGIITTAAFFALIYLLIRALSARKERIVTMAIQHNQPEVARAALGRGPSWVLYVVIGLIGIVFVDKAPWYASLAVGIVAIATAPAWLHYLTGSSEKTGKKKPTTATTTQKVISSTSVGPTGPKPERSDAEQGPVGM